MSAVPDTMIDPSSITKYKAKHHVRFVTAASLFDGHDAAINIMRRILQSTGVEVIHLGHNRSVQEVVNAAIQEDVHGIAISSYQGGHVEYFKYMIDLLKEKGAGHGEAHPGLAAVVQRVAAPAPTATSTDPPSGFRGGRHQTGPCWRPARLARTQRMMKVR